MSTRTTIRTIERGVRLADKSRSGSPGESVKQQLHAFVDHSHNEKSEMGKLNNRMSAYVNRVKALEAENTKLIREVNDLQAHWGDETRQVKEQYEQSLYDLRGRIDDSANLKAIADVRHKRAQYENVDLQRQLEDAVRLSDIDRQKAAYLEHELALSTESGALIKKAVMDALKDIDKYKQNRDDTYGNLVDLLDKLDDELFRRVAVEYNNQTLREHIEFIKQIHERELTEMGQLTGALPFNDQIEFYKDQLKRVISNIRKDYEQLHVEQTREMEEWMRQKKEELASRASERDPLHDLEMSMQLETMESLRDSYDTNAKELEELKRYHELMSKRLADMEDHLELERVHLNDTLNEQTNEIKRINDDISNIVNDYNSLNSNKAILEYEIHVYKRLLDSQLGSAATETAHVPEVAKVVVVPPPEVELLVTSNAFGGKVQNKKEKKGAVGISESSPDGKCVIIENTGNSAKLVDLSGWLVRRVTDNNTDNKFKIPAGTTLAPDSELIVWGKAYSQHKTNGDLISDFDNWGVGINSVTHLLNARGDEKSTFHQQITFSSRY